MMKTKRGMMLVLFIVGMMVAWPGDGWAQEGKYQYAYMSDGNIWLTDETGSNHLQLTTEGHNSQPIISPDGNFVAYLSISPDNLGIVPSPQSVCIANLETQNINCSISHLAVRSSLVWSSDSSQLAYVEDGRLMITDKQMIKQLMVVDNVAADGYSYTLPAWSPDGEKIACILDENSDIGLWIIDLKTGRKERLMDFDYATNLPIHFSPDGQFVTIIQVTDELSLWKTATDGSRSSRLHNDIHNVHSFDWHPSGKSIFFSKNDGSIWKAEFPTQEIDLILDRSSIGQAKIEQVANETILLSTPIPGGNIISLVTLADKEEINLTHLEPPKQKRIPRSAPQPRKNLTASFDWYRYQGASDSGACKSDNCGPTSVAMAIQFGRNNLWRTIEDVRWVISKGVCGWTSVNDLRNALNYFEWPVNHTTITGMDEIRKAVNERGHIVIVPVIMSYITMVNNYDDNPANHYHRYNDYNSGHFVVVKGISSDGNWVIVHDPNVWGGPGNTKYWYSNGQPKGKDRYYSYSEFTTAFARNGNNAIEILDTPTPPDTTPPTITATPIESRWHKQSQQITLSASDASGIKQIRYKVNDGAWQNGSTISINTEGWHRITYQAIDNNNNYSSEQVVAFGIDTTPPTGTLTINQGASESQTSQVYLNVSYDDGDNRSGVEVIQCRHQPAGNWQDWQPINQTITWQLPAQNGSSYQVDCRLKDRAGNISEVLSSQSIQLDFYPERPASPNYQLKKNTTGLAGQNGQSTNYQLKGTLGQPSAVSLMTGSNYTIGWGYWREVITRQTPPPSNDQVALTINSPTTLPLNLPTRLPVHLANIQTTDNLAGVAVSIQTSDPTTLKPACDETPWRGQNNLFDQAGYVKNSCTADSWSHIRTTIPGELISGTGTVIELPFVGLQPGCVTLTFQEHQLSDSQANLITHTVNTAEVCVSENGRLTGQIQLQSRDVFSGVKINLVNPQGTTFGSTFTDEQGNFSFVDVPAGKYPLYIRHDIFKNIETTVTMTNGQSAFNACMWAGDVDGDGDVDYRDWIIEAASILPVNNPQFDIDGRNGTNIADLVILNQNIGHPLPLQESCPQNRSRTRQTINPTPTKAYLTLIPQTDGHYDLQVANDDGDSIVSIGARLTLPAGMTVDQIELQNEFANGYLSHYQSGTELYITAAIAEGQQLTTTQNVVSLTLTPPETQPVTLVAGNVIAEPQITQEPVSIFMPIIIRQQ